MNHEAAPATYTYTCWDDSGVRMEIDAATAKEAAEEYAKDSGLEPASRTRWAHVWASLGDDDAESFRIDIDAEIPVCVLDGNGHVWSSPIEIVGGIKENPGVFGKGGGVLINEVCQICGCGRVTDTWACDPNNGERGLAAVEYRPGEYDARLDEEAERRAEALGSSLSPNDWDSLSYACHMGTFEVDEASGLGCVWLEDAEEWASERVVKALLSRAGDEHENDRG